MATKSLRGVQIKDAAKGEVSAVFSTFDVIDKDGDVTPTDAFTDGEQVRISAYGHTSWRGVLPVGKGRIFTNSKEAVLEGQFFLDTQLGRDTFEVVKQMGELQEWSYGYDVLKESFGDFDGQRVRFLEKLKVNEVSPVMLGAGENTRTLAVKSLVAAGIDPAAAVTIVNTDSPETPMTEYKRAIRPHKAAVTARQWDGGAVVGAIPDGASVSDLRSVFAYVDPDGDPEVKGSYRFPHHHGIDGPANVRAVTLAIGVLNGARGGANLPEEDRKAVYNHLAAHLRDADREPPELRAADGSELKNYEKAFDALAVMSDALEDALRVGALRAQRGKSLSPVAIEAFEWWGEDLTAVVKKHGRLMKLLHDTPREAVAEEFVRFLRMQNGL